MNFNLLLEMSDRNLNPKTNSLTNFISLLQVLYAVYGKKMFTWQVKTIVQKYAKEIQ